MLTHVVHRQQCKHMHASAGLIEEFLMYEHVCYERLSEVPQYLQLDEWFVSTDAKSGYYHDAPIPQQDTKAWGFTNMGITATGVKNVGIQDRGGGHRQGAHPGQRCSRAGVRQAGTDNLWLSMRLSISGKQACRLLIVRLVKLGTLNPGVSASKPFPTCMHYRPQKQASIILFAATFITSA